MAQPQGSTGNPPANACKLVTRADGSLEVKSGDLPVVITLSNLGLGVKLQGLSIFDCNTGAAVANGAANSFPATAVNVSLGLGYYNLLWDVTPAPDGTAEDPLGPHLIDLIESCAAKTPLGTFSNATPTVGFRLEVV